MKKFCLLLLGVLLLNGCVTTVGVHYVEPVPINNTIFVYPYTFYYPYCPPYPYRYYAPRHYHHR